MAEWDRRLAASGFRDIENRGADALNVHHETADDLDAYEIRSAYLAACRLYVRRHGHKLRPRIRAIWRLHARGIPYRAIAARVGCSLSLVAHWIRRFRPSAIRCGGLMSTGRGRDAWAVKVRFSDDEAAAIVRMSEERGTTPTGLARKLILRGGTTDQHSDRGGSSAPAAPSVMSAQSEPSVAGAKLNSGPFMKRGDPNAR